MEQNDQAGAGAGAPPSPGPEPDEKAGRKRGPHPDAGKYVVLAADAPEGVNIELNADGEPLDYGQLVTLQARMVWFGDAEDGRQAKQYALDHDSDLDEKVAPGGAGSWLVAVPLMNIKWRFARAEQPPPIVKGL